MEQTLGNAPKGISQKEWERMVIDECVSIAKHNAKFRQSIGANEALRIAKENCERRLTLPISVIWYRHSQRG
jgi:hypothetical protein